MTLSPPKAEPLICMSPMEIERLDQLAGEIPHPVVKKLSEPCYLSKEEIDHMNLMGCFDIVDCLTDYAGPFKMDVMQPVVMQGIRMYETVESCFQLRFVYDRFNDVFRHHLANGISVLATLLHLVKKN